MSLIRTLRISVRNVDISIINASSGVESTIHFFLFYNGIYNFLFIYQISVGQLVSSIVTSTLSLQCRQSATVQAIYRILRKNMGIM